jgi:hypothetical protein
LSLIAFEHQKPVKVPSPIMAQLLYLSFEKGAFAGEAGRSSIFTVDRRVNGSGKFKRD